jgi:hypothetical protein
MIGGVAQPELLETQVRGAERSSHVEITKCTYTIPIVSRTPYCSYFSPITLITPSRLDMR